MLVSGFRFRAEGSGLKGFKIVDPFFMGGSV